MARIIILILLATIFSLSGASAQNLKGQNQLMKGIEKYRLLIKFSAESIVDVNNQKPVFKKTAAQARNAENKLIIQHKFHQVIEYTEGEKKQMRTGNYPQPQTGKFDHMAFRGLVYVEGADTMSKEKVLQLANEFEQMPSVEYASLEPLDPIAPPTTPDFTAGQDYKYDVFQGAANVNGINAEYAWSIGITGQGVKIADIEWGFDYQHEDLINPNFVEHVATTNHNYDNHGTAVAGIMYARDNGFGVTGMVHGADKFYGISEVTAGRVPGITKGLQLLSAGDVLVLEMQTGGQNNQYVPADYNQAVWDITQTATKAGVIVVAAAGNGAQNLDDPFYESYRNRGDNGAIIVGGGTRVGRDRAIFSTYGSNVHLQGWGDWCVTSTGYTSLYNGGTHANYTNNFSGTSSATPIVASAVVAVQSYSKQKMGITLSPKQIRTLLIQTGTPQGTGGHIGPLPNIKTAIEALVAGNLNVSPVITLTSPIINTTFLAPVTIAITANASDEDGTIAKVEFYKGATLLNTDTIFPYSFNWENVSAGTYSITAKVYDNKGATAVSPVVTFTVIPTLDCTAPAWSSTTTYLGDEVYGDGLGEVVTYNNKRYRAQWWTLGTAPGTSNSGWLLLSACPKANPNPTVSITSPATNTTFKEPATITITASAADSAGSVTMVEFYEGTTLLYSDSTAPYTYDWTNVAVGTYVFTAKAYDNSGSVTTSVTITGVKVEQVLGIINDALQNGIYPNPTDGIIHVSSNVSAVEIYSIQGKLIANYMVNNAGQVDLTALHNGTYILKVIQPSQSNFVKLVKQ